MICICERICVRKVPLSDAETSVALVKHCFASTRAVCICVHLHVFPLNMPRAWMATQVSETGLHLELIDLAGTMCIHG